MEPTRERASTIALLTSIPMIAQLVAGRAVRDTVFLTEFEATVLPRVMAVAAACSLAAAWAVSRVMPRAGPRVTATALTLVNGSAFALEGALLGRFPGGVAVFTYIHVSFVGALVVSAFSSVINERFDPMQAKTVVAQVGTGATLGGVLGGVFALFVADVFAMSMVLYGLAALSVLVGVGLWAIGSPIQRQRSDESDDDFGARTIVTDAYLRRVALTILLLGAVGVFVDYAMKAEADARFQDSAGLLTFFASFYMATALLTFLLQAGAAQPLLQRVGLGGTMAVLPLSVALSAGIGAVWTRLWSATLARGAQTIVSSSLFRSGYELLYTPLPTKKKRATKALIDIACNRIGYGAGSLVIMALVAIAASATIATTWVLVVATIAALLATWMVRQLHEGYVAELAASLEDGSLVLDSNEVYDATTLHTIAESAVTMNRQQLLQDIEELERDREAEDAAERDHWVDQLADLVSYDPQRVFGVLLDESLDWRFAGGVIELLGNDLYARPAYRALERMGPRVTGQLVDALLAPGSSPKIRRRIPKLLGKIGNERAARGLVEGLQDAEFEVRYRCGHALASLADDVRSTLPKPSVMRAVATEVASGDSQWRHRRLTADADADADIRGEVDALLASREDRALEHVFTLLSLALDREAIMLSLRALASDDDHLRGTALEYLHNVLPDEVRTDLWPRLTEERERHRTTRTEASSDDLLRSMRSLMLDRKSLGK